MHQSGHSRAHNMQLVQFSSSRAMTPRVRGGRWGWASGYSAVWVGLAKVLAVVASPLRRPGMAPRDLGGFLCECGCSVMSSTPPILRSKEIFNLSTRFAVEVTFSCPLPFNFTGVIEMFDAFNVEAISTFFSRSCLATVVVVRS